MGVQALSLGVASTEHSGPPVLHPQHPHLENKSYAQWLLVLCLYGSVINVQLMPTYPHFGVS